VVTELREPHRAEDREQLRLAKVAFTIKVIDSDEINAFALPGGTFSSTPG